MITNQEFIKFVYNETYVMYRIGNSQTIGKANLFEKKIKNNKNSYFSTGSACYPFKRKDNNKFDFTSDGIGAAHAIVIDIDAHDNDFEFKEEHIDAMEFYGFFDSILRPNAVIYTGRGLHLWYVIEPLLYNKESLKSYYKDTVTLLIKQIQKELKKIKTEFSANLIVDKNVSSVRQLIRIPGSMNKGKKVRIVRDYNTSSKYTLQEIQEYYEEEKKEDAIKNKILYKNINGQMTEEDLIKLNEKRLDDMDTLIELRRQSKTLIGSRQNILSNTIWCSINMGRSKEETLNLLHEKNDSMGPNKIWNQRKLNKMYEYVEKYHERRPRISNQSMCEFCLVTEEEKEFLYIAKSKKHSKQKTQRKKILQSNKIFNLYTQGYNYIQIAEKLKMHRTTVSKYLKEEIKAKAQEHERLRKRVLEYIKNKKNTSNRIKRTVKDVEKISQTIVNKIFGEMYKVLLIDAPT